MTKHKVFQIGFSKCGTSSLELFFKKNGHKTIHWKKKVDKIISNNIATDKPLLHSLENISVYTDSDFIRSEFSLLEHLYPDAKFIYNIRPINDWIHSRTKGTFAGGNIKGLPFLMGRSYRELYNLKTDKAFSDFCKVEWDLHRQRIFSYFRGNKKAKLLIFDITKDGGKEIANFLKTYSFKNLSFPKINVSINK